MMTLMAQSSARLTLARRGASAVSSSSSSSSSSPSSPSSSGLVKGRWRAARVVAASASETESAEPVATATATEDESTEGVAQSSEPERKESLGGKTVGARPGVDLTPADPRRLNLPEDADVTAIVAASMPLALRLGTGIFSTGYSFSVVEDDPSKYSIGRFQGRMLSESSTISSLPRPEQPLKLYEFEGCPFCRKVREAVCILNLDVVVYPCPKDGPIYREYVKSKGGKAQFPYLEDPNTEKSMYESDDIINYLFETYGPGIDEAPTMLKAGAVTTLSAGLGLAARMGAGGGDASKARAPEEPLTLWGYEGSPFVKLVREVLNANEIPHVYVTCPRGSPKRQQMWDDLGTFQVPYLVDPSTGFKSFESTRIVKYIQDAYGA